MKPQVMLLLALVLIADHANARIEAPDHVIYGNVTVFGDPAAPGQLIQARLLSTGEVIAAYELGRDGRLGDQFALRFHMDTVEPRVDGRARPGDPVSIFIGAVAAAETTVGSEGVAVRLDIDPQNLGNGPSLNITDANVFEGNTGLVDIVFNVSLNTTSPDNVVLFWQTEDINATGGTSCLSGVDYIVDQSALTLPPGAMEGIIAVSVCGDIDIEPTETFLIRLTGVQGAVLARNSATATILDDDDVPTLRVANVTVTEPPPGGTAQAVFRPKLSKNSDTETRFGYQTSALNALPGIDFEAVDGEVTIPIGELEAQIIVPILHAPGATPPKSFELVLTELFRVNIEDRRVLAVIEDPGYDPAVTLEQELVNGSDVIGLAGPTALALSPDGEHAYVTSEALSALLVFDRNVFSGHLSLLDSYDVTAAGFTSGLFAGAIDVIVSPDGAHVYVAAREDNAILVLDRNLTTGRLNFIQNQVDGQLSAPDATRLNAGLAGVRRLQISADGAHLYAAGSDANAIAVFARDGAAGTLRFLEAEVNGENDPDDEAGAVIAMSRPSGLALSADGGQVYVASRFGDSVQVFNRDSDTASADYGRLSFVTAYQNGLAGIVGLDGAFDVVVSSDNQHVYVTAEAENAVVLFDRNADGSLSQRSVFPQQIPDLPGLGGAQGLAVSPDGLELFATGFADSSLTIFKRAMPDNDDGLVPGDLSLRQTLFDEQGAILNMAGATRVTLSSDDKFIYVVANQDNAIVVLKRISLDMIFFDSFESP